MVLLRRAWSGDRWARRQAIRMAALDVVMVMSIVGIILSLGKCGWWPRW
jgi:hypothetical protein